MINTQADTPTVLVRGSMCTYMCSFAQGRGGWAVHIESDVCHRGMYIHTCIHVVAAALHGCCNHYVVSIVISVL